MPVVSSVKNVEALTMTFVAEFEADVDRVWQVWADPRKLERWWGPPTWPATFERFEFEPGGQVRYYMTGPDGSTSDQLCAMPGTLASAVTVVDVPSSSARRL